MDKHDMNNSPISVEAFLKFFEDTAGVHFIDASTGKSVRETIAENKVKEKKSDYDLWLEQQDEYEKSEQEMGHF